MYRGIRQGCPVSAILFLFVVEILAIGFQKPGMTQSIKIIQHADDCTLPLKDEASLKTSLEMIQNFSKVSGMKLNMSKTECLLIGSWKNILQEIENVTVNKTCLKTLGTYIGQNDETCYNKNWTKIVDDLEKRVIENKKINSFWQSMCNKQHGNTKIRIPGSMLNLPDKGILKKIQSLLYNLIWNKKDRIKRKTQIGRIQDGGIVVVDILMKLKSIKVF